MAQNDINQIESGVFKNTSLEYLDLSENKLKFIPTDLPRSVRILKVPKNQLRFIRDLDFLGLNNLGQFALSLFRPCRLK